MATLGPSPSLLFHGVKVCGVCGACMYALVTVVKVCGVCGVCGACMYALVIVDPCDLKYSSINHCKEHSWFIHSSAQPLPLSRSRIAYNPKGCYPSAHSPVSLQSSFSKSLVITNGRSMSMSRLYLLRIAYERGMWNPARGLQCLASVPECNHLEFLHPVAFLHTPVPFHGK